MAGIIGVILEASSHSWYLVSVRKQIILSVFFFCFVVFNLTHDMTMLYNILEIYIECSLYRRHWDFKNSRKSFLVPVSHLLKILHWVYLSFFLCYAIYVLLYGTNYFSLKSLCPRRWFWVLCTYYLIYLSKQSYEGYKWAMWNFSDLFYLK